MERQEVRLAVAVYVLLCLGGVARGDVAERLGRTWAAMAMVESGGDPDAVGDGGLAVGILQIQPVMVAEVNRIVGERRYTLADRWDVRKSVEMFCVYSLHHWPDGTPEQWARGWNGGPAGPRKAATLAYWRRVTCVVENFRKIPRHSAISS